MFEKILQELKTKYKNLGLSETILKAKAKQIEKAVKKEEEIADAVAGVEEDLAIFQSFADQNRTLAKKIEDLEKAKGTDPKPADPADPKPADPAPTPNPHPTPTGEVPDWARAIIESNKTLTENLAKIHEKEAQQTNAQKLQAKLDELKVSKTIQALIPAGLTFENDEAIEAYAADMKTKSDAIAQEFGNSALAATAKPLFGEAKKEGEVSPDVQAYIEAKKPAKTNE